MGSTHFLYHLSIGKCCWLLVLSAIASFQMLCSNGGGPYTYFRCIYSFTCGFSIMFLNSMTGQKVKFPAEGKVHDRAEFPITTGNSSLSIGGKFFSVFVPVHAHTLFTTGLVCLCTCSVRCLYLV